MEVLIMFNDWREKVECLKKSVLLHLVCEHYLLTNNCINEEVSNLFSVGIHADAGSVRCPDALQLGGGIWHGNEQLRADLRVLQLLLRADDLSCQ